MIAILKYNAGNTASVENALNRLGYECRITDDHTELQNADKIIFPGVGEASSAMRYLKKNGLDVLIPKLKQPVLGICLGMQLMCRHSAESDTQCLGIFQETVLAFPSTDIVPHMGWNNLRALKNPLFEGLSEEDHVYFVHSYYAQTGPDTTAVCDYILPFSAALQKENFYAVQFHPEKSGTTGDKILRNFLNI